VAKNLKVCIETSPVYTGYFSKRGFRPLIVKTHWKRTLETTYNGIIAIDILPSWKNVTKPDLG
jgi:hypothetical protein